MDKTEKNIPPSFLITIDTEGDNLWSYGKTVTTRNAEFLLRFQSLCESYGFKPTYLTNYEMAKSQVFRDFGADLLQRNTAEIGMHLHAWDSPPLVSLTEDDTKFHPYLIEYPELVMDEKIKVLTAFLEDTFQVKMLSHRAGRWAFNETYAKLLLKYGYGVDCSVTPYVSWSHKLGAPDRSGGTDYRNFPDAEYFLDLEDISRPGGSSLLEIPVTIMKIEHPCLNSLLDIFGALPLVRRSAAYFFPSIAWLRPNGQNIKALLWIVKQAVLQRRPYIEFILHSSEFMPEGSPTFSTERDIERLYENLGRLFDFIKNAGFTGRTLSEHRLLISANEPQKVL